MRRAALWIVAIALHVWLQVLPAVERIVPDRGGRDFASYYYAADAALDGEDPYDTATLGKRAREDRTRKSVNPYFYPPPFLLTVAWAPAFSLHTSLLVMLALNEALLLGCLALLHRAFAVPLWAIALLATTFMPIPDHAWMGQANLLALTPALCGLALAPTRPLAGGALVGLSAMMKMSPALFLLYWALRRNWRAVGAACATAVLLSVATLPLVGIDDQLRFYLDILPGFASGDYHGLTVPISMPSNHSIPDLWDRVFSTPSDLLSQSARTASALTTLGLLGLWAWTFRKPGNEPAALGALTILMVLTPVYTYEHHLVFLLLAVGAAARLSPAFFVPYFFLAWSLQHLRTAQGWSPDWLDPWLRESKFIGAMGLFGALLKYRSTLRSGSCSTRVGPAANPSDR